MDENIEDVLYEFLKNNRRIVAIVVNDLGSIQEINIYSRSGKKLIKAADVIANDRAISIGLETGNVNKWIHLAENLSCSQSRHVTLYLSNPNSDKPDMVAFDSNHPSGWNTKRVKK